MCSTACVIHKYSLLLNQHNGDDASHNYEKKNFSKFIFFKNTNPKHKVKFILIVGIWTKSKVI